MNNIDGIAGFEHLPIGFIQALFEFYRATVANNPELNVGDIAIKDIEPSMRSAIIRGDYVATPISKPEVFKPEVTKPEVTKLGVVKPIQNSEIFNLGHELGLTNNWLLKVTGHGKR